MKDGPYILLVGVDYSELADRALHEAFAQASRRANSEVHVLSALLPVAVNDPGYATFAERPVLDAEIQTLRAHVELRLDGFRTAHPDADSQFRVVSHVLFDAPAHGIVELSSALGADLIVIGTHNRKGLDHFLLGSVAEGTVRNARCPVLVIPAPTEPKAEETIAPPCAECVRTRTLSEGKEFWCAQHSERHGRRHTYHQSDSRGRGSNFPLVFK